MRSAVITVMSVESFLADAADLARILTAVNTAYGWWRKKCGAKGRQEQPPDEQL
jgi:hypothetical protein